jgi:Zn-dependent membrane protease YugP
MLLVVFSFLAWILLLVDFSIPGIAFVKLAIILISLPVLFSWVVRARPRTMQLDAIPADALPKRG